MVTHVTDTVLNVKTNARKSLAALSVLLVFSFGLTEPLAGELKPGTLVGDLTVEYMTNPLGIDVATPRFGWQIHDLEHTRGQKQTAYHVLAASSMENLAREQGDLWDSGKVASDQSVLVSYAGKPLTSGIDCHWKVKVWLEDGNATTWSEPARFSVGLLKGKRLERAVDQTPRGFDA